MIKSTTVVCIRKDGKVTMAADGQVTLGETVIKQTARKTRRLYNGQVLAGFAGSTADAFALFTRFEGKLEEYRGNLSRAAVELAKDWRTDRALRHLQALLIVADKDINIATQWEWGSHRTGRRDCSSWFRWSLRSGRGQSLVKAFESLCQRNCHRGSYILPARFVFIRISPLPSRSFKDSPLNRQF